MLDDTVDFRDYRGLALDHARQTAGDVLLVLVVSRGIFAEHLAGIDRLGGRNTSNGFSRR